MCERVLTAARNRCGLLNFARENKVVCSRSYIRELLDQCISVAKTPEKVSISVEHYIDATICYAGPRPNYSSYKQPYFKCITAMNDEGNNG
jgi:hypothetical protein